MSYNGKVAVDPFLPLRSSWRRGPETLDPLSHDRRIKIPLPDLFGLDGSGMLTDTITTGDETEHHDASRHHGAGVEY